MNAILKNLTNKIDKRIADFNTEKSVENILRYDIGRILTEFYRDNKKEINSSQDELLKEIDAFYDIYKLDEVSIINDKYKKSTPWTKIQTAIADWLKFRHSYDGYGVSNLNYMQQFYRKYKRHSNNYNKAMKLDWSHNIALLKDRLSDDERSYYLEKAVINKWTVKELEEHIREESFDDFIRIVESNNYYFNIERLHIENYKSLVEIEIKKPSKLMVFAGANATGKSNLFEALEFLMHSAMTKREIVFELFGGLQSVLNRNVSKSGEGEMKINIDLSFKNTDEQAFYGLNYNIKEKRLLKNFTNIAVLDSRIEASFSRVFLDNSKKAENKIRSYDKLWLDGANLNQILSNIFRNKQKEEEIIDWIKVLIPEIKSLEIQKDVSGRDEIVIIEKSYPDHPFTGNLISEGTNNIIGILALVYQSDNPQFICIEEPEIGLNPAILSELIAFFRDMTIRYNHHIWITTHSVSLVSALKEEELVIVNKKNGQTNVYQCVDGDFEEMDPGEAWMSNMLKGGGLPW